MRTLDSNLAHILIYYLDFFGTKIEKR